MSYELTFAAFLRPLFLLRILDPSNDFVSAALVIFPESAPSVHPYFLKCDRHFGLKTDDVARGVSRLVARAIRPNF
jgi:hypothetical protein